MVDFDGVTRSYNAANQMTNDGTNTLTYDNNGNLRTVGSDTYTWDRANRLSSVGNHSYVYDGLGNRVQQTVSSVVTDYLNDLQPGLTKLLKQDDGTNTEQFVHGVRGIHAVDDGTDWNFYAQDGLGSVRALIDDESVVQSAMAYDPYGNPMASYGAGFGYTGEQTDGNGQVYLRARYYTPSMGIFSALDPIEGKLCTPMSLNGYSWVEGNVPNMIDPSGMICECDNLLETGDYKGYEACITHGESHPTPCYQEMFAYNRFAAAKYAIDLSTNNFARGQLPAGQVNPGSLFSYTSLTHQSGVGTSSAVFVSEAMWHGGLPMTIQSGDDPNNAAICGDGVDVWGGNGGWRACSENGNATQNWKNHQGLREYITSDLIGGSVSRLNFQDILSDNFVSSIGEISDKSRVYNQFIGGELADIQTGDYVYLMQETASDFHGLLIVGWGEATTCTQDSINNANHSYYKNPGRTVPYVADSNYGIGGELGDGWLQDPRPRPFYCTTAGATQSGVTSPYLDNRFKSGLGGQYGRFEPHNWGFYHIPPVVTIPCNRQFRDNKYYPRTLAIQSR